MEIGEKKKSTMIFIEICCLEGAPNFLGLEYLLRRKLYCGEESKENLSSLEELIFS